MFWRRSKSNYPLLIIAVFGVGLLLAGALLYRWINRVSVADREQQVEFLGAAMRSFRGDFAGTLLEIRSTFRPVPRRGTEAALDEYLAEFYSQWRASDPNGPLVATLSIVTVQDGKPQLRTLSPQSGKFEPQPWPASLQSLRDRMVRIVANRQRQRFGPIFLNGFPFAIEGDHPVVVVPLVESGGRGLNPARGKPQTAGRLRARSSIFFETEEPGPGPQQFGTMRYFSTSIRRNLTGHLAGWCLLALDIHYLQKHLLPSLLERTFSGPGLSGYQVAVVTGKPSRVIFSSVPGLKPSSFASPDAALALFNPHDEFGLRFLRIMGPQRLRPPRMGRFFVGSEPPFPPGASARSEFIQRPGFDKDAWTLVAKNKMGSIDAMVARARRRNLAMGFGVLFLLACSMGALVFATHRARELARREMEFVAGVSHELRTPLAAIHSAGFNLASGVVRKPNRVREYGSLVQQEARRLTDMVEQVLNYAGVQSGERHYKLVPTAVSEVIERALAEYAPAMRKSGWQVEKKIEENLPPVLADSPSLESAVKNLLGNAMKYADVGKWIGIGARAVPNEQGAEVQISVEDRGPGIAPSDLPHVFEPFYRSKRVLASPVPGAGLGLSILKRHMEAHGGRVSVESSEGKGCRFILHLPAISALEREAV